ncbi:AraC family transcriptional regulator [Aquimarina addita]|uniref:AraC family transcriptional regulator n=1 Tax=Aquimarina addita TaxID=870485 RepID=A0ABP7X7Z4_9FLAO
MREIEINSIRSNEVLEQLNLHLKGNLDEQWGEHTLEFDNDYGKGLIRSIEFDWGVSLIDYDVSFRDDVKIVFKASESNPIEFIFVSEGNLRYKSSAEEREYTFEKYQNIIISTKKQAKETYIFPNKVAVKVNFIYVMPMEYSKKKNNNLSYLDEKLFSNFQETSVDKHYSHYGNFNLKIADQIKQLQDSHDNGVVRTLSIEGQLNLIMAMQILEHNKYQKGSSLPDSLSKDDIRKIHKLADYILDNIAEPLSISSLASQSGLTPKKLQLGFNVLYGKSVHEYIKQLKLEIARDAIMNTNDSISEIVYNIGLKSRSYFSKIFFEMYGLLPTEYRKKQKIKKDL